MGGPNLEVFKFATYVAFPLLVMLHYSNPEWYAKHVLPVSCVCLGRSNVSYQFNALV